MTNTSPPKRIKKIDIVRAIAEELNGDPDKLFGLGAAKTKALLALLDMAKARA